MDVAFAKFGPCSGPLTDYDDINVCYRHKGQQLVFYTIGGASLAVILFRVTPAVLKYRRKLLIRYDPGYQPLLADQDNVENDDHEGEVGGASYSTGESAEESLSISLNQEVLNNYGSLLSTTTAAGTGDAAAAAGTDVTGATVGTLDFGGSDIKKDPPFIIATVVRSTADRLKFAAEILSVYGLVILNALAQVVPDIKKEWEDESFSASRAALFFWVYSAILVTIRLILTSRSKYPRINLWVHCVTLNTIAWFLEALSFYSSYFHPVTKVSRNYNFACFFLTTVLLISNWTAKIGDRPARLYMTKKEPHPSLEPVSSLFSLVTYSWIDPLVWKGYWHYLNMEDIWALAESDHAKPILDGFRYINKSGGMAFRLARYFKVEMVTASFWAFVGAVFTFFPSLLLKKILDYVEDPQDTPYHVAWFYVIMIMATQSLSAFAGNYALLIGRRVCVKMRAIIIGEVYAKGLRRKAVSGQNSKLGKKETSSDADDEASAEGDDASSDSGKTGEESSEGGQANLGTVINLMSVDAFKISEVGSYFHYLVQSFLIIILAIFLLYSLIGWSALLGTGALFVLTPLNYFATNNVSAIQDKLMSITDERVEKTNEVLQSIRIIKYFAWESRFTDQVMSIRERELDQLKRQYIFWIWLGVIWFLTPLAMTVASFGGYTLIQKQELTTSTAFTCLSLFYVLRTPMDQLSTIISDMVQCKVSIDRINAFLSEDETDKYKQLNSNQPRGPHSPVIGFEQATLSWLSKSATEGDPAATDTNKGSKGTLNDFKLRDIDISFELDKLNLIVGPTGSGKSSLLLALLGEMELDKGRVFLPYTGNREFIAPNPETGLKESVAYCCQQAWLLNDTVKNNILFASEYNEERYNDVIKACALARDLEILEAGDETEIGEKGITLSGGQKQRISLARAVYSSSRHLLLDDCLSAVDSHTALAIYENCLTGPLCENRTVILVSHNVALSIRDASFVVVMDNGRVKVQGHPSVVSDSGAFGNDDLVKSVVSQSASQPATRSQSGIGLNKNASSVSVGRVALDKQLDRALKKEIENDKELHDTTIEEELSDSTLDVPTRPAAKLIKEEERAIGDVKKEIYIKYIKMIGSPLLVIALLVAFAVHPLSSILETSWVKVWTSQLSSEVTATMNKLFGDAAPSFFRLPPVAAAPEIAELQSTAAAHAHGPAYYLLIYFLLGIVMVAIGCVKEYLIIISSVSASRRIFKAVLDNVLRAKLRFFDSTPIGRIMNRFSKDIEGVDQDLAFSFAGAASCGLLALATACLITLITPTFIFAAFLMGAIYYLIGTFYLQSSRELKRLDSVTKSPIFQQFSETLVGVTTIRAYGDEQRFIKDNLTRIDTHNRPFFYLWVANRWLALRIDIAGAMVSFFAAVFAILSVGKVDAGWVGVSLSYALAFSDNILWLLRLYAVLEMNMNSVERLVEYMDIESEAPYVIEGALPPVNWPNNGEIEVHDLSLRYAQDLPTVIKNVTFKVEKSNKIGIVGRTGAGKSTIITALFRFLEADTGYIKIDGVDISTLGLYDLRQALAIIPQDPTLFSGTIRSNLDPFDQYTDEAIFEALIRVHLIQPDELATVASSSVVTASSADASDENVNQFLNLQNKVTEGGNNLSQGQRQLMCLARSLLRAPKILMLDEATASIDYDTDAHIQATIRGEFKDTTILTVAHRLRSIIDYDKILVMDAGTVVEYDHPYVLIKKRDSVFSDMCVKSGDFEVLEKLASEAYKKAKSV